ncbi:MAG TPA: cyclic pyranopterin monophosphate synthase MoaC [Gemmatimonadaceae bacterium]|nr:cyclic pyranopterin monophosphate synthase MoaC [Gemmatimonadaceae bacterium]
MTDRPGKLSHVDDAGRARMVDVSAKPETERMARARGTIEMQPATVAAIRANQTPKGDVLGVARVAGVLAAKRTAELIPLCHSLALTDVDVSLELDDRLPGVRAEAVARTVGRTGVEMEAIVAVSIALVTVYDMAKAIDKTMVLGGIELVEKRGGASGR